MELQVGDVLKCHHGVVFEVVAEMPGTDCDVVCCGQPVPKLKENVTDGAKEKHVPVVEKIPGGYKVKVGAQPHPMVDDHWIVWVELEAGNQVLRQKLYPGEAPEAIFKTDAEVVKAREYCNKHGLWKA